MLVSTFGTSEGGPMNKKRGGSMRDLLGIAYFMLSRRE